jgi:hypothetical protein
LRTPQLQQLQLLDIRAGSGSPDRACANHRTDGQLIEQYSVSGGQAAFPIRKAVKAAQSFSRLSSKLVDLSRVSMVTRTVLFCFTLLAFRKVELVWAFEFVSQF